MCDFKPGDEVVCVTTCWHTHPSERSAEFRPQEGAVYTCAAIEPDDGPACDDCGGEIMLSLLEALETDWFCVCGFRKVQRRDLSAWLATINTIEEPKRKPAKAPA